MIVIKFDFDKIFSLTYMGKLCHLQNSVLLLWYKDTFIDSYCLLQIDYESFHLILLWVDSVLYINCQSTWGVATLHTPQYLYRYRHGYGYGIWIYMECGDTLYSIISIWTWIWLHVHILSLLHTLDIKIDLFKIGTILSIIIQGF